MEKWEIRPPAPTETPEPIVTKICMGDYVGDPYPYAKFYHDTITPFVPQICENAHQVTRLVYFGSSFSLQPRPLHRFLRSIPQITSFRAKMCLLGSQKNKSLHFDPVFPPKRNFLASFWGDFVKKAFTMWMLISPWYLTSGGLPGQRIWEAKG